MSTLYNLEPQPTAKVLLNTTTGDLVLELFAKQAPLASRNFLQHCLDGYYDNTIFHRLVPGFIIQGGDPTGTGSGGVSAINNGASFEDEFHSRLKFNRRGLLGMANSGESNDNTSQFFLTLDKTPELQGKNTMFGRIEGDTIYNLMKMAEADLINETADRPLYPTSIVSAEILLNPFSDMVKQATIAIRASTETSKPVKKKRKAAKTLLSFGGDEGEEPVIPVVKKVKVNPNFVSNEQEPAAKTTDQSKQKPTRKRSPTKSQSPPPKTQPTQAPPNPIAKPTAPSTSPTPTTSPEPQQVKKQSQLEKTNAEIAKLKASMKRGSTTTTNAPEKKLSTLESMIPSSSTRGRKRGKGTEDKSALDMFNAFKKRLENVTPTAAAATETSISIPESNDGATTRDTKVTGTNALDTEEKLCDLHFIANCQSCGSWLEEGDKDEEEDDNDGDWMAHSLSFAKDTLGKDLEWKRKMEEFEVIDPREKGRELVGKEKQAVGRDWDKVGREKAGKGKGKEGSRK